jgi:ABC-2 type transport system permease protein
MTDIATVVWKEWREFVGQRSTLLGMAIFLGLFSVVVPFQAGARWVESPLGVANLTFFPLFLVLTVIADAVAGERERHTLDTLLASRLPDTALLFGKVAAAVAYGWGLTLAALAVALVSASISAGDGLLLYPPPVAVGAVVFSLLGILLVTGAGILVSLRSATVRQAQQTLNVGLLLLGLLAVGVAAVLPNSVTARVRDVSDHAGTAALLSLAGLIVLLLDVVLFAVTTARFRRSRLAME